MMLFWFILVIAVPPMVGFGVTTWWFLEPHRTSVARAELANDRMLSQLNGYIRDNEPALR